MCKKFYSIEEIISQERRELMRFRKTVAKGIAISYLFLGTADKVTRQNIIGVQNRYCFY